MVRLFTFITAMLIIFSSSVYQAFYLPHLTEAEAFCKLWFVWLFSIILISVSVALEFSEQNNE